MSTPPPPQAKAPDRRNAFGPYYPPPPATLPEAFVREEWLALLAYTGLGIAGALAALVVFVCICFTTRSCMQRHFRRRRAGSQATQSIADADWPLEQAEQPGGIKLLVREAVVVLQPDYSNADVAADEGETWLGLTPSLSDPCEIPPHLEELMQQEAEQARQWQTAQAAAAAAADTTTTSTAPDSVHLEISDPPAPPSRPQAAPQTVELTQLRTTSATSSAVLQSAPLQPQCQPTQPAADEMAHVSIPSAVPPAGGPSQGAGPSTGGSGGTPVVTPHPRDVEAASTPPAQGDQARPTSTP